MRIALTGVSGFIGSVIARHLHEAGHTVTGLVRSSSRRDHVEPYVERFVVGDQSDAAVWPDLLDGTTCLIHNSINWQILRSGDLNGHYQTNLVDALKLLDAAGDRMIVYVSSIAAHHDMRPRWQGRIDEDHPTRPGSPYGAVKAAIEAHLWSAHFSRGVPFASIRPCAVYGIDPTTDRTIGYPIVKRLLSGKAIKKVGGGKFVHVDDVAATTVAAIDHHAGQGRVLNLADCYARWADLALMAQEILGTDVPIDTSSPAEPKNQFSKADVQALGVQLNRGHSGLRQHMANLVELMRDP